MIIKNLNSNDFLRQFNTYITKTTRRVFSIYNIMSRHQIHVITIIYLARFIADLQNIKN